MATGSFPVPRFVIAWPTGEIGGMGLEGAVRLGYRKELPAIEDPDERNAEFDRLVSLAYAEGKVLTAAAILEIDDVIDPADTRRWISTLVECVASTMIRWCRSPTTDPRSTSWQSCPPPRFAS